MKDLILVGAGGCAREVLQWVKEINNIAQKWNIKGFLSDYPNDLDKYECDYKIIGSIKDWEPNPNELFVIAISDPKGKEKVVNILKSKGANFETIIHPNAFIGSFNHIGEGTLVYPGARITVNATIGNFVTILDSTTIGHDVKISDYSTICGGCGINGHVSIENHAFIGSHSTIIPWVKIGNHAYVGAGSIVIRNVRAGYKVFGNPAKKVEF